jgi:UTP--glucose-1-phosphate uridylyltransferase
MSLNPVVRKAIFPVAGLGTRFLPATKANPKEMLAIVDKPLIQYAVEEAVAAGITELIFVTSSSKRAIEDHFDSNFELEYILTKKKEIALLQTVKDILPEGVSCIYVRQREPLGLGHAVWCAREVVGDEFFAVILADDLIDSTQPCLGQLLSQFDRYQASVIAVEKVANERIHQYGVVSIGKAFENIIEIDGIIEKPKAFEAPSDLGVVGRYVLSPRVFELLEQIDSSANGELQLTDAIAALLDEEIVLAYPFLGKRYDCGNKLGYLQATVAYGLKHPELGEAFREHLLSLTSQLEEIT